MTALRRRLLPRETRLGAPRRPLPQGKEDAAGGDGAAAPRRDGGDSEGRVAGGGMEGSWHHLVLLGPFPDHASHNPLCGTHHQMIQGSAGES